MTTIKEDIQYARESLEYALKERKEAGCKEDYEAANVEVMRLRLYIRRLQTTL